MYMTVKEEKETPKNPSTPTLIAFKPRQVILAEKKQTLSSSSSTNPTLMALVEQKQSKTLTAEDKTQLLHSILHYLQSNQFSKSLKYLLKDAQIQDDSWKATNLDLEDIYSKYLEISKPAEMKSDKLEQLEDVTPAQETVTKKNKKKTDEKVTEPLVCDSGVEKSTTKPKKNKKNKITSEDAKQTEEKLKVDNGEIENNETAKSKNKKKKNKSSDEPVVVEDEKLSNDDITLEESEVKPKEKKKKKEEKVKNDKNDSKKRKRLASSENENENENENQPIEESVTGETKRRKIEETNGVEKSNKKKQQNGSVEPKTINPFQRVKVDEVEVDERLQDNSYWAKDGADIGYGAKAQEILGQVRGKDFRHEKTKKKRGSYRGGQIDLQSHSVKFNYSDEE